MKANRNLILIVALATIFTAFYAFKPNSEKKKYQYLTVFSLHYDHDKVFISIDGKEYKNLDLQKQVKGPWDSNPMINLIHQYENEGWELGGLQFGGSTSFYMKKEME